MRVLITGGEGFLGANLAKELINQGHEVTVTSLNRSGLTSLDALGVKCRIEYGNVIDREFVNRVIASTEAEWVFHLAAISIVRIASASPALALETNIMGTLNVLDACELLGAKCIIASSDKAYGDHKGVPYCEDMPLKPTGAYEVSKACADHIGQLYRAIVVRCANLYGPADLNWSRLIPNSIRRALHGETPQIYGDAISDKREWIYVDDAVKAYIRLAEKATPGAYNVGSGAQMSPMEMGEQIAKMTGCEDPQMVSKDNEFYEIREQVLNCSKMYQLGWNAEYSILRGLTKTLQWYKEYFHLPILEDDYNFPPVKVSKE
jgi:CDP-glucose 4,6-dehydratase